MDCLDYADNKDNADLWLTLVKDVSQDAMSAPDIVATAWDCRATWWPEYHFSEEGLFDSHSPGGSTITAGSAEVADVDLCLYKASFAHLVLGPHNPYTQAVLAWTQQQPCQDTKTDAFRLWHKIRKMEPLICNLN